LLENKGMTAVVITFEVGRRGFTAEIAVDALFIDIEFPGGVLRIFVGYICHKLPAILERNIARANHPGRLSRLDFVKAFRVGHYP
jgi:hypothetical protein